MKTVASTYRETLGDRGVRISKVGMMRGFQRGDWVSSPVCISAVALTRH